MPTTPRQAGRPSGLGADNPPITRPGGQPDGPTTVGGGEKARGNRYQNGTLERWDAGQQRWLPIAQDGAGDTEAVGDGPYDGLSPSIRQRLLREQPGLADALDRSDEMRQVRPPTVKSLLDHPPAPQVLESVLGDLASNGPQSLRDRYNDAPTRTPLALNREQQAITKPLIASLEAGRRAGPGFRLQPTPDTGRPEDNPNTQQYLDNLLATGEQNQQVVTGIAERLAAAEDGRASGRPFPKDPTRAKQKVDTDYEGDAAQLLDIAAARVEFGTTDQVYRALGRLTREPGVQIVRLKDRLADKPQDSGYGDLLLNLRLPDGHVGELRLQLGSMQRVDDFEHSLYEVRRDIEASAKAEGRPPTAREDAIIKELERRSNEFYQRALEEGTR